MAESVCEYAALTVPLGSEAIDMESGSGLAPLDAQPAEAIATTVNQTPKQMRSLQDFWNRAMRLKACGVTRLVELSQEWFCMARFPRRYVRVGRFGLGDVLANSSNPSVGKWRQFRKTHAAFVCCQKKASSVALSWLASEDPVAGDALPGCSAVGCATSLQ